MAQVRETELDVHALGAALWRRARLIAALVILAAVLTFVGFSFVNPLYTADTRILIENRESPLTQPRDAASSDSVSMQYDESAIASQVEVLRSREIADEVINKLNLTRRPDFDPATQPSLKSKIMVMLGLAHHPAESTIRQRVMDTYYKRISVYPLQRSRVLGVDFVAPDPELAAEVVNAIADSYVDLQQQAKRQTAVEATDWLEQEIDKLRGRVADAEASVEKYRTSNGLFDTSQQSGGGGTLSTQQLTDINAELARARAARVEAESRAASVKALLSSPGGVESSPDVLSSELIQRLNEREVALRAQIADLSTTLLPSHPRIKALNQQLANLDGQIRQEAAKVLEALNTGARIAAAREQSLAASLNEAKGVVSTSNDKEIQLRALEREADAQRALLETFLGRYREAAARTDANYIPADARIISRAVPPTEPSYPKKTMMAICAALAMLILASTVTMVREFTSGRAFRIVGSTDPLPPSPETSPLPVVAVAQPTPAPPSAVVAAAEVSPSVVTALAPMAVAESVQTPIRPVYDEVAEPPRPDAEFEHNAEPEAVPDDISLGALVEPATKTMGESWTRPPEADDRPETSEPELGEELLPDAEPLAAVAALAEPEFVAEAEPVGPVAEPADATVPPPALLHEQTDPPTFSSAEPEPGAEPEPVAGPAPILEPAGAAKAPKRASRPERQAKRRTTASGETPAERFEALAEAAATTYTVSAPAREADERGPDPFAETADPEGEKPGAAQLAEILANPAARLVLFAGIKGGEGAGDIAYSSARMAAGHDLRLILMDIGAVPAPALGMNDEPGLGHLLAGEAAFGEVIRRDEESRVHIIPKGATPANAPLQRLEMVVGALTHSYDKVVVIADSLADWPAEHLRPDLVALICGPEASDEECAAAYDAAISKGARSALIVRFANDSEPTKRESEAA